MTDDLEQRLREACDRTGKPSGAHMIDSQRMIARHMAAQLDDEDAQCIAQVADCMAHCIENEALLFECLRTEALQAADEIARLRAENEALREAVKIALTCTPSARNGEVIYDCGNPWEILSTALQEGGIGSFKNERGDYGLCDTAADRIEQLRKALIEAGRNAGALLADDVSDEFLAYIPGEVKGRIEALEREVAEVKEALVAEREETLWSAYSSGLEKDGRWTHMFMSDGEWLAREVGLDPRTGHYDAEYIKAAIPRAARAAIRTGEAEQ